MSFRFFSAFRTLSFYDLLPSFKKAECKNKDTEAENTAKQLTQIFENGGNLAADPQTMIRIMEARQAQLHPPSFGMLLMPIKMMSMVQSVDGFRLDLNMGISQAFQMGGSWSISNTKPSHFALNSAVILNNPSPFEEPQMVQATQDSSGRVEFHSDLKLYKDVKLRLEGLFPNTDMNNSQIVVELVKNFKTASYSYKFAPGMKCFGSMHNLYKGLSAGFEATYIDQLRDWKFAYGFRYSTDLQMIALHYNPLRRKEIINLGYLYRASRKLNLVGEIKLCPQTGDSDALLGFQLRFNQGNLKGSFSTGMKAASQFTHNFDPIIGVSFTADYDFMRTENNALFGVNLVIGGM